MREQHPILREVDRDFRFNGVREWKCNGCRLTDTELNNGIQERYSLGIFAGRYCDPCWDKAPYRKEGREGFDPDYCGESYDEEGY